ncbi:MAG: 2Fe-2S iron-sulfur cluster-binding protein [Clostridiales bacterium]|nr:2Fe-2S iron-sulfur cluster-binding protein [Clostridiales bacterium]
MEKKMLNVTIDGISMTVEEGTTILEAAENAGIEIPTLCYLKGLTPEGACRICMVEVKGNPKLVTACSFPLAEGNEVITMSDRILESRKSTLDLLLSNHKTNCFSCPGNGDCKLQNLCYEYGIEETSYPGEMIEKPIDDSNPYFTYNPNLCILCHRCVNTCAQIVKRGAISTFERGFASQVSSPFYLDWIDNQECEFCGNCVQACPTGALRTKNRRKYRPWEVTKVLATCYNCKNGNGCQRYLLIKKGKIVDVEAKMDEPNHGRICNKGRFEFYNAEIPEQVAVLNEKERARYQEEMLKALNVRPLDTADRK